MESDESINIKSIFESKGITVMFLAEMMMVSRPTIYRYFTWFDECVYKKIPIHVLDYFNYAVRPDVSKQDALNRLSDIHDMLLHRRKVASHYVQRSLLDNAVESPSNIECFTPLVPGNQRSDGSFVLDRSDDMEDIDVLDISILLKLRKKINDAIKSYISDNYESKCFCYSVPDHTYVANFRLYDGVEFRSYKILTLYHYLEIIHELLSDDLVVGNDIRVISNLRLDIDKAVACLSYLTKNCNLSDDESYQKVVDDLNRPTFDITLARKWYVSVYVAAVCDDYPDESQCMPFISMVEGVSVEDASYNAHLYFKTNAHGLSSGTTRLFGPFDDKQECSRVYDYLKLDWESSYGKLDDYTVVESWLDSQTKKPLFHWTGE